MATEASGSRCPDIEIFDEAETCKQKSLEFLKEFCLPNGLLPLEDIEELGINRGCGFVWLKQREKKEHLFQQINKVVVYDRELSAFMEKYKLTGISGVRVMELAVAEICLKSPASESQERLTFVFRNTDAETFLASAFEA